MISRNSKIQELVTDFISKGGTAGRQEEVKKVCQCVERGGRIEGRRAGWNIFALWLLRLISFDHATIIISTVVEVEGWKRGRGRDTRNG